MALRRDKPPAFSMSGAESISPDLGVCEHMQTTFYRRGQAFPLPTTKGRELSVETVGNPSFYTLLPDDYQASPPALGGWWQILALDRYTAAEWLGAVGTQKREPLWLPQEEIAPLRNRGWRSRARGNASRAPTPSLAPIRPKWLLTWILPLLLSPLL